MGVFQVEFFWIEFLFEFLFEFWQVAGFVAFVGCGVRLSQGWWCWHLFGDAVEVLMPFKVFSVLSRPCTGFAMFFFVESARRPANPEKCPKEFDDK